MPSRTMVICTLFLSSSSAWAALDLYPAAPPEAREEVAYFSESELTADAARNAISELERDRRERTADQSDHDLVVEGNLRLIEGYLLKYRAERFRSEDSVSRFCKWLRSEGRWPE